MADDRQTEIAELLEAVRYEMRDLRENGTTAATLFSNFALTLAVMELVDAIREKELAG